VISNLSRHASLSEVFRADDSFLEALTIVLDHTLKDLVYYTAGIIINLTLHESTRKQLIRKPVVLKLVEVLKDSNIEDLDISKVSAKALLNLT